MLLNRTRDGQCVGLTLWKWGQFKLELWLCNTHYTIARHRHPCIDSEIMYLRGDATFYRVRRGEQIELTLTPKERFRKFTILSTDEHWFTVRNKMLLVLNFQRWLLNVKPTSASINFVETLLKK